MRECIGHECQRRKHAESSPLLLILIKCFGHKQLSFPPVSTGTVAEPDKKKKSEVRVWMTGTCSGMHREILSERIAHDS